MKAQPRKGRYFAISLTRARVEAQRLALLTEGTGPEGSIELRNPEGRPKLAAPLLEFRCGTKLVVFSLPEQVDRARGEQAILRAFEVCRLHRQVCARTTRVRRVSLLVYLEGLDRLKVGERTTWYQERKYRGTAKFSTAFRLRKVKVEEREVGEYAV